MQNADAIGLVNEVWPIDITDMEKKIFESMSPGMGHIHSLYHPPTTIISLIILFYFDINDISIYLYPKYVTAPNIKAVILNEPTKITKHPNISFDSIRQHLAIGTGSECNHCIFIYDLTMINTKNTMYERITWKPMKLLKGHTKKVTAVEFNRSASCLVSYSAFEKPPTVRCWNVAGRSMKCIKTIELQSLTQIYSPMLHLKNTKLQWIQCANYFEYDPKYESTGNLSIQREDGSSLIVDVPENSLAALKSCMMEVDKLVKQVGNLITMTWKNRSKKSAPNNILMQIKKIERKIFEKLTYYNIGIEKVNNQQQDTDIKIKTGDVVLLKPAQGKYEQANYDKHIWGIKFRNVSELKLFVMYGKGPDPYWSSKMFDSGGRLLLMDATSGLLCEKCDILAVIGNISLKATPNKYYGVRDKHTAYTLIRFGVPPNS